MIALERRITASPTAVWAIISRLDDWHRLLPTIDDVTRTGSSGPVTVGSTFRVRQPGLPTADYVVTEWRPEEGFTWASTTPGVRTVATHAIRSDGRASVLRLGIGWSGPLAWLVRPLVTGKARRYIEQEASSFAQLAEENVA